MGSGRQAAPLAGIEAAGGVPRRGGMLVALRVTGARPRHGNTTEPTKLQAAIFNNTEPRINTRISVVPVDGLPLITIQVDAYPQICSTKAGLTVRRVMAADGP